ncbi:hypothetical protein SKAU_G00412090 [Synaphobranchus kaupii]|uniref:ribonuclease H n=1 Tax=Synaphobranchus kaupii TaxID=118154 RepID=A0A9Q1E7X9_SYNKA|nr:hypothetical protein SKAU_G00412090 [Synaphobranchus kaupii]
MGVRDHGSQETRTGWRRRGTVSLWVGAPHGAGACPNPYPAATPSQCTLTHVTRHGINTGEAVPIRQRPHLLPLSLRAEVEGNIKEMAAAGVIRPSESPWAFRAVLVRKKDGSLRFCVDYRRLNAFAKRDSYPLPHIDNTLDSLGGSTWFSLLDLRSGYWQVPLTEAARPKTAFTMWRALW